MKSKVKMSRKYPSKISYGLFVLITAVFYCPLIWAFFSTGMDRGWVVATSVSTVFYVFAMHLLFNTYYIIEDNQLKIVSGFFKYQPIAISDIIEIRESNSLISSPASSFDRIKIRYGKYRSILISPRDKVAMVEHLKEINPSIIRSLNNR